MADVTTIPDGTATSAAQLEAILSQVYLNIYNLETSSKHAGATHGEFGAVGYKHEPKLKELYERAAMLEKRIDNLPAEIISQWDNPAL